MDAETGSGGRRGLWRSRWAAIGAAVAVTLGGGGFFVASAASSVPSSVVTIDPARILDTRDPLNVGLAGPFVSAVSQKLQVTGSVATSTGTRTVVPSGATGVLLNVTVVAPAAAGFVSIRPGDATGAPSTSSLNFDAGDIIPNAVQVGLPTSGANAGKIDITYDAFGVAGPSTDLLIDVVGYMVAVDAGSDAALLARIDALDAEIDGLDAEIVALKAGVATNTSAVAGLHNSVSAYAGGNQELVLGGGAVVRTVSLMPPANGKVIVNSSGYVWADGTSGAIIRCSITQGTTVDGAAFQYAQIPSPSASGDSDVIAGTRGYDVAQGVLFTVNLVCDKFSGNAKVSDTWLSAIFTPA